MKEAYIILSQSVETWSGVERTREKNYLIPFSPHLPLYHASHLKIQQEARGQESDEEITDQDGERKE